MGMHRKNQPTIYRGAMGRPDLLNAAGVMLIIWKTDINDLNQEGRPRIRAFQEKARGIIEAENFRVSPRDPIDILMDAFGADLERAMVEDRITEWLDTFAAPAARN